MREGIHVRYTGEGVREVKGIGVFQRGTVAWAPREVAMRLLAEDCFEAAGDGRPARALVVRLGQKPSGAENPPSAPGERDLPDVDPAEVGEIERALEEEDEEERGEG